LARAIEDGGLLYVIHGECNPVLREWVLGLPLREQGTLLTCIRGCDLVPKLPLDSVERRLVSAFRYAVMNPADPREVDVPGAFFSSEVPRDFRASSIGHYPQHWVAHIMHGAQVIAYRHPDEDTCLEWHAIYKCLVDGMHLRVEPPDEMVERLSEDRIASGKVVS
jgi:hypothetical protein